MSTVDNERHAQPLANRLVDDEIRRWLDTHLGLLAAQTDDDSPERKIVDQARHLHLDGYGVNLTPRILDALRRAGLLKAGATMSDLVGAALSGVTDELRRKILQAIADPGHFLKRGGDYTEPIPEWSARAVALVLDEWLAGCTVVQLPALTDDAVDDHGWGTANATVSTRDGRPRVHIDADDGDSDACLSWPAEVAERAGLALVATARRARQLAEHAAGSGVGDPR